MIAGADSVSLAGDSVIDTISVATLAGIAHFTRDGASLVVADSPDAIAAAASDILAIASAARVVSSSTLSAAQAEQLVPLAIAGKLTFAGSNHLNVADSAANILDSANADGVALASVVTIIDSAANLATAAMHAWGNVHPLYELIANDTVTGAQAAALAALGGAFSLRGHGLTMADDAAGVTSNAAALNALGITAQVTDSVADIDAAMAGLLALGTRLASVQVTNAGPVGAMAAGALYPLASLIIGGPIAVADTASAVGVNGAHLLALGQHLGTITLTDIGSVAAGDAIGLLPLVASLAGGTSVSVLDTQADVLSQVSGLVSLGAVLGTVSLSDGTVTDAATAAALLPIQAHFGAGVQLTVQDSIAAISADIVPLTALQTDGRIASITAGQETVANILALPGGSLPALQAAGVTATVADTAAHVNQNLDALEALHLLLTGITLTNTGTPTLSVTLTQLSADADVLALVTSGYTLDISDTAAAIQADLTSGSSRILAHLGGITHIVANDGGTVSLTGSTLLAPGVDDGTGSALAKFLGGSVVVTDVAVADIGLITALMYPPTSVTIADTVTHIQGDLASGTSALVAALASIAGISVIGGGTITLQETQVLAAGVDDGAGSVFSKISGASLMVTNVTVADIGTIATLPFAPIAIAMADTGAAIQADLTGGSSGILANLGTISGIQVTDGAPITLTGSQILAAGIDDGPQSALTKLNGATVNVTNVTAAELQTLETRTVLPTTISLLDSAAGIQADLTSSGGSAILSNLSQIGTIVLTQPDTITLTAAQALETGMDDGPGSAFAKMTGASLSVNQVPVADIGAIRGLWVTPQHITINDTAAQIQSDLTAHVSALVGATSAILSIKVADAGTIGLTVAQIRASGIDDGPGAVLGLITGGSIAVTNAAISNVAALTALPVRPNTITIIDSQAHLLNDLALGQHSVLRSADPLIDHIKLSDAGVPDFALSLADIAADSSFLQRITTPYTISLSDTAAAIQADLTSGTPKITGLLSSLQYIEVTDNGTITMPLSLLLTAGIDDGAASVFGKMMDLGGLAVQNDVSVAEFRTLMALGVPPTSVFIVDSTAHLQADLASPTSAIAGNIGSVSGITVTDGNAIVLTSAAIQASGVDDGPASALALMTWVPIVATDVLVQDVTTLLSLAAPPGTIQVVDTANSIFVDFTTNQDLVNNIAAISSITVSDGGTITLTVSAITAPNMDDGPGSVFAKLSGGSLTISDATVADLGTLDQLGVRPNFIRIYDTAANIQADLASGKSMMLANKDLINAVNVLGGGGITLTTAQLLQAGVDDGTGSILALANPSLGFVTATQVSIADLPRLGSLTVVPTYFVLSDTVAHVAADLSSGASAILAYLGAITSITVPSGSSLSLSASVLLSAAVDDFSGAAIAKITGATLTATGATLAQVSAFSTLAVHPTFISVSDTAAAIQADLTSVSSVLHAHPTRYTSITVNDGGTITLTKAVILSQGMDDGASSVFSRIAAGTHVQITGAQISDLNQLVNLTDTTSKTILVTDTATHVLLSLRSGSSQLVAYRGLIGSITMTGGNTLSLTAAQVLAAGMDDGPGSVMPKIAGVTLQVTNALASDVAALAAMPVAPTTISVIDTAAHIQADLAAAQSVLLQNASQIGSITVTPSGTIALTPAQALEANMDDGVGSIFGKMTGETLAITGAAVADVGALWGRFVRPQSIGIVDTAANIQSDLASGSSALVTAGSAINQVHVTDGGTITLTVAQIKAAGIDDSSHALLPQMTGGSIAVTGAAVADIPVLLALPLQPATFTILDSSAHILADLARGQLSVLQSLGHEVTQIVLNDGGTPPFALSLSDMQADSAVLQRIVSPFTLDLADTAAAIQADLTSGHSAILALQTALSDITVTDNGTITMPISLLLTAGIDDGAASVFGKMIDLGGLVLQNDASVAEFGALMALGVPPTSVFIVDSTAHLQADLASPTSAIAGNIGSVSGITVTDGNAIVLTSAAIQASGVDDSPASALALMTGAPIVATDVLAGDVPGLLSLDAPPGSIQVVDSTYDIQLDFTTNQNLVNNNAVISHITVSDGGTITLTVPAITAPNMDDGPGSVFAKLSGGSLNVLDATVADLTALNQLSVRPNFIQINDTAANIQADLASGTSMMLANKDLINAVTVGDGGTIALTEAQLFQAGVDDGTGSILALAHPSLGSLTATQVSIADLPRLSSLTVVPTQFVLSDTVAHVAADLSSGSSTILAYLGAIQSIIVPSGSVLQLSPAVLLSAGVDASVLKIAGATLTTTPATLAQFHALGGLTLKPASIDISDSAAVLQADITSNSSEIAARIARVGRIVVNDGGTLALTATRILSGGIDDGIHSLFSHIAAGTLVQITNALLGQLTALANLSDATSKSVLVSDSAANLKIDLVSGSSKLVAYHDLISAITVTAGSVITLTAVQALAAGVDDGPGSVLAKMSSISLVVTSAYVSDLGALAAMSVPPTSIRVTDTAASIQADLTASQSLLLAQVSRISSITLSAAGTITLTKAQILQTGVDDGIQSLLAKMTGESLTVNGAAVADITTLLGLGVPPATINVVDSVAAIQADLTSGASRILAHLGQIGSLQTTQAGVITLTEGQVRASGVDDSPGSALAKLSGATLTVVGVAAADIGSIMGLTVAPTTITVSDTAAHLIAAVGSITAHANVITGVSPTDTTLSVSGATALYSALNSVVTLNENGLTIADTATALLAANPAVLGLAGAVIMTGNASGLTAAQATTLSGILGGHLAAGQTLGLTDTAAELLSTSNAAGVALATNVALSADATGSAADATALAGLHGFTTAGYNVTIQDTTAHLLDPAYAAGLAIATNTTLISNDTVSAQDLSALAGLPGFTPGIWALNLSDTAADILGLSAQILAIATMVGVADTTAAVLSQLTALQTQILGQAQAVSVKLDDATPGTIAFNVTATDYVAYAAILGTFLQAGIVAVTGSVSQMVALAGTLAADQVVGQVAVIDTAANILGNLTALNGLGAKFQSVTISDPTLNATMVASLLTIPHLNATNLTISDTGGQLATVIQSSAASGLAFLNAHTVTLSADSVVTASQALSLETLTSLQKNGHTLTVWDTASHLTDSVDGYLAAVSAGVIDQVYLKTSLNAATVLASTAATLFSIPTFHKDNPDGSMNALTVQDTAAHIESSFASLNGHISSIARVVISASTTVTCAVAADLLTLGARLGTGVAVTVRDTATHILALAPAQQQGSPSFSPSVWALSANATVTVANALSLASLSGFQPGTWLLTLSADGSASVAEANTLSKLSATLRLGGHHISVAGSISDLNGLNSTALTMISPDVHDTFGNIIKLAPMSGLLSGTITVTDSATPDVAAVTSFLSLLGTGGIPAANVSFAGHIETVTDTLTHLRALMGSSAWINNASVHASFALVAADKVFDLIDPASTSAYEALTGTTLLGSQVVTAAQAQSLAALQSGIRFDRGGYTITIDDTAANLLDPANADGDALADVWQLSVQSVTTASDAETLLSSPKFVLGKGGAVVVSDSADNLLDGVLAGDISASPYAGLVSVQLAAPEVLDAHTATALVALPQFNNTTSFIVQDSSDYLLKPAAYAAESAASQVLLAGDETVSIATMSHLTALPHFKLTGVQLTLASDDYADAAAVKMLLEFNTRFDPGGHTITLTQDALTLSRTEYAALQSDNIVLNGHALSAQLEAIKVASSGGAVQVGGVGIDGATLNVYAANGTVLSRTAGVGANFTASASESGIGNGVVVTETEGASAATSESVPIIVVEQNVLLAAATATGATFATSGAVQISSTQFTDLYVASAVPAAPANPVLVYDPAGHTLSLDIAGHAPLVLVTLGAATTPASLDPSEIFVQHFV